MQAVTWWVAISVIVAILVALIPSTLMVLGLGMLPTLVAFFIDRTDQKLATFCVGGLNTCGVFPYLMKLWTDDDSVSAGLDVIADPFALAVMYAGAGFGWMLYMSIPPVVSAFLTVLAESRVTALRQIQSKIVDEWGSAVSEALAEKQAEATADGDEEDAAAEAG